MYSRYGANTEILQATNDPQSQETTKTLTLEFPREAASRGQGGDCGVTSREYYWSSHNRENDA